MGIQIIPAASGGLTASDLVTEPLWEQIDEYKSSSPVSAITFSNIPQTYRNIKLNIVGLVNGPSHDELFIRINNDSTASTYSRFNYSFHDTLTSKRVGLTIGQSRLPITGHNNIHANVVCNFFLEFPNYTTDKAKKVEFEGYYHNTSSQDSYVKGCGTFRKGTTTSAMTSLTIFNHSNIYILGDQAYAATLWGCK